MQSEIGFGLSKEPLGAGAALLRQFAVPDQSELLAALQSVSDGAPFRHMITPGGYRMSVAMTNCGSLGWVTDKTGYRYVAVDPLTGLAWPPLPESFLRLARLPLPRQGFLNSCRMPA